MNTLDELQVSLLRKAYTRELAGLSDLQDAALRSFVRDVFVAGRGAGERVRRAAPARIRAGVESRRSRWFWCGIELLASFTTLAGMWMGSTTVAGACWYLAAGVLFIAISVKRKLHGLQPLNLAALLIETWNLVQALR